MALSPQYSWPEPDNSSLVKNGAQDIRALGDAIDTSVWNVGYGQAGKNKIINGAFDVWQRGNSITQTSNQYTADMWRISASTAFPTLRTITRETFTPAEITANGFAGASFYLRSTLTTIGSSTGISLNNRIENVTTLAGQIATLSFWAKSDSTRTQTVDVRQNFGSGGSTQEIFGSNTFNTTTSWQRFTFTITFPSISGKTIGTGSWIGPNFEQAFADGSVFDLWGVQLEYGSKATPFQTATGTIQGELAACQRYYLRTATGTNQVIGFGSYLSSSLYEASVNFPVEMRTSPTIDQLTGTDYYITNITSDTLNSFSIDITSTKEAMIFNSTEASGSSGYSTWIKTNNASAFLGFSAEL
jgi:hypothetical protein